MKIKISRLKRLIKEAAAMKVAEVVYGHGVGVNIDGEQYNVTDMAMDLGADPDDEYDTTEDDVFRDLFLKHGVTHVVDPEAFDGDQTPRPVEEFLSLSDWKKE